jgi:hypothetical protein
VLRVVDAPPSPPLSTLVTIANTSGDDFALVSYSSSSLLKGHSISTRATNVNNEHLFSITLVFPKLAIEES